MWNWLEVRGAGKIILADYFSRAIKVISSGGS
jgi:hypothetical protein